MNLIIDQIKFYLEKVIEGYLKNKNHSQLYFRFSDRLQKNSNYGGSNLRTIIPRLYSCDQAWINSILTILQCQRLHSKIYFLVPCQKDNVDPNSNPRWLITTVPTTFLWCSKGGGTMVAKSINRKPLNLIFKKGCFCYFWM